MFVILFILTVGVNLLQSVLKAYLNTHIVYDIQQDLFNNMLSMKMEYFDSMANGAIISRITGDTKQIVDNKGSFAGCNCSFKVDFFVCNND